jgi:hypothetical protein
MVHLLGAPAPELILRCTLCAQSCQKLGMSERGVPSNQEASDWPVPDALMFGRAKTEVDFDTCHQVQVACAPFLGSAFQKILRSLRG